MKKQTARLAAVVTGPGLAMTVTCTDGRVLQVDVSELAGRLEAFAPLENASEFATARVADFGWTLDWSCGASLDSDRLQEMALERAGDAANHDPLNRYLPQLRVRVYRHRAVAPAVKPWSVSGLLGLLGMLRNALQSSS